MKLKSFLCKSPILLAFFFIGFYILFFKIKNYVVLYFSNDGIVTISSQYLIIGTFNFIFGLIALNLIKKLNIKTLAGVSHKKIKNWEILLFPIYIIIISLIIDFGDVNFGEISFINWFTLFFWTISIGFSEELMFRGFLQSIFIQKFTTNKTSLILCVLLAAIIFGLMHLVNYSYGFYGETVQVLYSIFFGILFGATLLLTRKIWPIILTHMLIDFFGVIDIFERTEVNLNYKISANYNSDDFLYLFFLALPCLIYGTHLLLKTNYSDIEKSIKSN